VLLLIAALYRLATHQLSGNRWLRATRFAVPAAGLGLTLTFTLSALGLLMPSPTASLGFVGAGTAVGLLLGYLTPDPRVSDRSDDDEALLAALLARRDAQLTAGGDAALEPGDAPRRLVAESRVVPDEQSPAALEEQSPAALEEQSPAAQDVQQGPRRAPTTVVGLPPSAHRPPAPRRGDGQRTPWTGDRSRGCRGRAPDVRRRPELGRGGFGVVWEGYHRHLQRRVAIKQLPAVLAADPAVRKRFVTEAQVLASLDYPHVVPVYDYVEQDDLCLLVMEHLPGGTVWDLFADRGLSQQSACAVMLAACAGLHHAHTHSVLHRDVKPENLLLSAAGVVKVTDFGIAKVVGGGTALATGKGEILGTPAYMAPEQAEGKHVTAAVDVYAAGTLLYELLAGRLPFSEQGGGLAVVYRHVYDEPVPLSDAAPTVPRALCDVVMQALAKDPGDRPPSAEALGVAVGEAATAAFGVDWIDRVELPVLAPGPILDSCRRTMSPGPSAPAGHGHSGAPATVVVDGGVGGAVVEGVVVPAQPAPAAAQARVRPSGALLAEHHAAPRAPLQVEGRLVPLAQLLQPPAWPRRALAVLGVAGVLTATAALLGPQEQPSGTTFPPGAVTLASPDGPSVDPVHDSGASDGVALDLSEDVRVVLRDAAADATSAELRLRTAGVPIGTAAVRPVTALPDGTRTVALQQDGARLLAAGPVTATLTLLDAEARELGRSEFAVRPLRSWWMTAPGVLAVAGALALGAYTESILRSVRRRGEAGLLDALGLAATAAGFGALLVVGVWVAGLRQPSLGALPVAAAMAALAGPALAVLADVAGRRARLRRLRRLAAPALSR
jgi:serine/threonine-protein kinase